MSHSFHMLSIQIDTFETFNNINYSALYTYKTEFSDMYGY